MTLAKTNHKKADLAARAPSDELEPVRARILTEARRHFFSHGFRGVTMDDVAAELGMSKKTLYAHFASKTALLHAVIEAKFAHLRTDMDEIFASSPADFAQTLQQLLACIQKHSTEPQPPFLRDVRRDSPELFAFIQSRRREVIQHYFGRLFTEGRRVGLVRKDLPTPLMVELLVGVTDSFVTPERLAGLGLTIESAISTVLTVFLEGVLTPRGSVEKNRNLP